MKELGCKVVLDVACKLERLDCRKASLDRREWNVSQVASSHS